MSCKPAIYVVLINLALGAPLLSAPVRAEPRWVRLSLTGDAGTQMGISWNTLSGTAEAIVEFGLASNRLSSRAQGRIHATHSAALGQVSSVELRGLLSNRTYYYRAGGPLGGWSPTRRFRTGPPMDPHCAHFRFVYFGDSRAESWQYRRGASTLWPSILQLALAYKPLFALHGGDFVRNGRRPEQWAQALAASAATTATLPLMISIGNHDAGPAQGEEAYFNQLLLYPHDSGTEDFYAFVVGNTLFASLSTATFKGGHIPFERQARWLDTVLSKYRDYWEIIYMHHPVYTHRLPYGHPPNEQGQNAALVRVFNKHRVDLVIGSHNHFYERFAPSRCADPASETPCPVAPGQGTVYLTSGGAGAFPIFLPGGTNQVRLAASGSHHFLLFEVMHNKLRMEAITRSGATIDTLTITRPRSSASCPPLRHVRSVTASIERARRDGGDSCKHAPSIAWVLILVTCLALAALLRRRRRTRKT